MLDADCAVPGTSPQNFRATQVYASSVMLTWSRPVVPNGVVTSYTLQYNLTEDTPITTQTINTFLTVTSLQEYSLYEFVVYATTRIGNGPTASIVVRTKESCKILVLYFIFYACNLLQIHHLHQKICM